MSSFLSETLLINYMNDFIAKYFHVVLCKYMNLKNIINVLFTFIFYRRFVIAKDDFDVAIIICKK